MAKATRLQLSTATALVVIAAIVAGCSSTSGSGAAPSAGTAVQPTEAPVQGDFRSTLADLAKQQDVEVVWTEGPYSYRYEWGGGSATNPSEDEVARVAGSIARELSLYPDGFLRRTGLTAIVLVNDLFVEEDGGARGAAAYIFENRLFLDVPGALRAVEAGTRVRFVHHIVWHHLDELAGTMWQDAEWEALNPPDFEYGVYSRGGVHETRAGSGSLSLDYPGFLNLYSTGNLPDDKAEVYAYLMVIHSWVNDRTADDAFLRRKVAMMKSRLAEIDPTFNEDHWRRIDADSDDAARYRDRG